MCVLRGCIFMFVYVCAVSFREPLLSFRNSTFLKLFGLNSAVIFPDTVCTRVCSSPLAKILKSK